MQDTSVGHFHSHSQKLFLSRVDVLGYLARFEKVEMLIWRASVTNPKEGPPCLPCCDKFQIYSVGGQIISNVPTGTVVPTVSKWIIIKYWSSK